jgi:NhaP-type Na+/H+ or K+/H+ antiporter
MFFFEFLTMEETFIVTYIGAVLIGIVLGVLLYWIFEKDEGNEYGK